MVRQDRAKATRDAILQGAASVFEDFGYGNASLSLVADRAEVTKGALYFHFASKQELALAIIAAQHTIVVEDSQRILDLNRSALTTMILLCGAFAQQLQSKTVVRAGIRLTFEASAFGHVVREPYEDWIATMTDLAKRAQNAGEISRSVDTNALARFVVASFTGVQMVSEVLTNRADVVEQVDQMWKLILSGIIGEKLTKEPLCLSQLILNIDSGTDA